MVEHGEVVLSLLEGPQVDGIPVRYGLQLSDLLHEFLLFLVILEEIALFDEYLSRSFLFGCEEAKGKLAASHVVY